MKKIIIAGTDTGIGKTICSALLMSALEGTYFKPIQSGNKEDNDTKTVKELSQLGEEHFLKEIYLLTEPLSPHAAAEADNVIIEPEKLVLPENIKFKPLIIELAGGLMVPINRETLTIDVIKNWDAEVILCARTTLGTINHTLLSIEALQKRNITIAGIVFIGEKNNDNMQTINSFSGIKTLGYISPLEKIDKNLLIKTFYDNFDLS
jgi:dethiobiotin synthase